MTNFKYINFIITAFVVIVKHVFAESGSGEPATTDSTNWLDQPQEDDFEIWESWTRFFGWYIGDWSECSSTCGASYRYRTVKCTRNDITGNDLALYNEDELLLMDNGNVTWFVLIQRDDFCGRDKPSDKERCETPLCVPEWVPENWSQCDPWCGGSGVRTRRLRCMSGADTVKPIVFSPFMCNDKPRPHSVEMCDNGPCRHVTWETGEWSKCSSFCGPGKQIRRVSCILTHTGRRVIPSHCPLRLRPDDRQPCQGSCGEGSGDELYDPVCYDDPTVRYCMLVLKLRLCSHDFFHQMCCVSCRARSSYLFL